MIRICLVLVLGVYTHIVQIHRRFDIHAKVMTLKVFRICLMLVFRVYT